MGRNGKTNKGWGNDQTVAAAGAIITSRAKGQEMTESALLESWAHGRRAKPLGDATVETETDQAGTQEKMGEKKKREITYFNLILFITFPFMLYFLSQIQLEPKGLKNQVMQSRKVRIPGQRPEE